jgi:hypothetical protein
MPLGLYALPLEVFQDVLDEVVVTIGLTEALKLRLLSSESEFPPAADQATFIVSF